MQVTVAKYISLLANDVNQPHNNTKRDDIRIKMQANISLFNTTNFFNKKNLKLFSPSKKNL